MNTIKDRVITVLVMVFRIDAASFGSFFPIFSEVNFVRAVGRARVVISIMVDERNDRTDKAPMSCWVKVLVFVTMM